MPDHRPAGWSRAADGGQVSINVEEIGGELMVQYCVAEILDPSHTQLCQSRRPTFFGWQTIQAIWNITVTPLGPDRATLTNGVTAYPSQTLLDDS